MRFSTFLKLIAFMVLLLWVVAMALWNAELLDSDFYILQERYLPLSVFLIAVFLAGFLPPAAAYVYSKWRRFLEDRRLAAGDRTRADVDVLALDILEAQLAGRPGDARAACERLLARRPDDATTLLTYGALRRDAGDLQGAVEAHERARRLRPTSPAPLYELARDRMAGKDAAGASRALEEAARIDPRGSISAARMLRDSAIARGAWEEALRWKQALDLRLSIHPDGARSGDASTGLGIEFERALQLAADGRTKESVQMLRAVVKRERKFIPAAVALGHVLAESGEEDAALEVYRDGYKATGSPVFLQALEDHHISSEEEPKAIRALEELKALVARSDRDILPRFALGRLYYRLEMADEAYSELSALVPRVAHSPTLHYILARISERRGRLREAVEHYRTCIHELGGVRNDFVCSACGARQAGWAPRCEQCGAWSSVEVDLQEQKAVGGEVGIAPAPVWGVAPGDYDYPSV